MLLELFLLAILAYFVLKFVITNDHNSKLLPPGPWGVPILGHLPLLGSSPHKKLLEWKATYGPIIWLRFGSFPTVVISDAKLIKEAFSLQSFAGRSQIMPLIEASEGQGISWTESTTNSEQRQFVLRNLRDFGYGKKTIEEKIIDEISDFLSFLKKKVGEDPLIKFHSLFTTSVVNAFWTIVIGESFHRDDPQIKQLAYLVSERISRSDTPLSKLAMFVPVLGQWFPNFSGYNNKVAAFSEIYEYARDRIAERKKSWVKGQPRDLTDAYLDKVDETVEMGSSFHAKHRAQEKSIGDLLMAAVETQSISLEWFVNYMARNPLVQKRMQKEVDDVIGPSRLPALIDRVSMPYSEAVILELIRMSTIVPLGVFHRTLTDVEFHGYKIPAGTTVISNVYGCHHERAIWGDPENFRPERFLGEDGKKNKNLEYLTAFSSGKRACLGEGLAKDQLFLFTTSLMQNFTITVPEGVPEPNAFFGLTLQPYPFEAILKERH